MNPRHRVVLPTVRVLPGLGGDSERLLRRDPRPQVANYLVLVGRPIGPAGWSGQALAASLQR